MALIVETGAGVANAESYSSVADADTRLAALGFTTWGPLLEVEKEQALRRATLFMTQMFRAKWKGDRVAELQALDWPRTDVVVNETEIATNVVPAEVKNTCIDLAIKAAAGDLNPDTKAGGRLLRKKIGPLEQEYSATGTVKAVYNAAWMSLAPYLEYSNGSAQVIR